MDEWNPYEAPRSTEGNLRPVNRGAGWRLFVAWGTVFVFNMSLPLLLASALTEFHGRIGMWIASLTLFACGCWICGFAPRIANALIIGAAFVAITQFLPVLQIMAGGIGCVAGDAMGLAFAGDDDHPPQIASEWGGFIVTLVTGGILIGVSLFAGLLFRPNRKVWWERDSSAD